MDEGLIRADYISLHSPYDGSKILDEAVFKKMKKGVFIINTSRGDNIDESALLNAIESGIVKGAGLDVFESEPNIHPTLVNHPNISITAHIGASTIDAQQRIAEELVEKITLLSKSL
jgi:D-3-phosphoglycerate dehydrogenase